jgi:hypothetical protein
LGIKGPLCGIFQTLPNVAHNEGLLVRDSVVLTGRCSEMKTILIIDGADNCAYDCFQADEELFKAIFPNDGQDIEFIEDFLEREPTDKYDAAFSKMWNAPVARKEILGIDGVLFYKLLHKRAFYPNKRDSDLDGNGRSLKD